jgi:hypothetical protein
MNAAKPLHIFRAGKHTDANGRQVEITPEDLQASAAAYDVSLHEAPIVIGHPAADAPAYGWVEGLAANGDDLSARPHQIDAAFAEMVGSGKFKKISASFYHPQAATNPKPGTWYLRHVGFLGAQPPAVKGLRAVSFADADDAVTIEFGEWEDQVEVGLFRQIREWIISKFGMEDADAAVPSSDLNVLTRSAFTPDTDPDDAATASPAFSETSPNATSQQEDQMTDKSAAAAEAAKAAQTAEFAEREQKIKDREASLAAREHQAHVSECADFVEGLVKSGQVLPVHKDGLAEFMASLNSTEAVEFSEADGKKASKTPLDFMKTYLSVQPKVVEFQEMASAGQDAPAAATGLTIAKGYSVDQDRLAIHNAAVAFAEQNKVDYITAVKSVSKEQ